MPVRESSETTLNELIGMIQGYTNRCKDLAAAIDGKLFGLTPKGELAADSQDYKGVEPALRCEAKDLDDLGNLLSRICERL